MLSKTHSCWGGEGRAGEGTSTTHDLYAFLLISNLNNDLPLLLVNERFKQQK